jgi:hypothetical protein
MTPWDKFLELSKNGTADIRWVDGQWLDMAGVIRVQNARDAVVLNHDQYHELQALMDMCRY